MSDLKNYLLKQCSCGSNENNFYICSYNNCEKRGFVCPYCLIEDHGEHATFCIPINYFQMQDLAESSVKEITKYKEALQNLKNRINILFEDEICFLKEMENLSSMDYNSIIKYDLLPKLLQKPIINKNYILSEQLLFQDITKNIKQHYNNISNQIISLLNQIKSTHFQMNTKILQIVSDNSLFESKLFGVQSSEHILSFPILSQNENRFLHGVGYISQVFSENPNSTFTFEIIEKAYNNYNGCYQNKSLLNCDPIHGESCRSVTADVP